MRLSESDKNALSETFKNFSEPSMQLYLFGSRTNDTKKGGDIDLLIVFDNDEAKLKFSRLEFIVELKKKLGDRKIDLTFATEDELSTNVFLRGIIDAAIKIESA